MRRVTIAVIGNAKTTRANVDALISDVVDSVDEATIATVYDSEQSDGQTWAQQFAEEKNIPFIAYPDNGYDHLFSESALDELRLFMLWDDEDPACQLAASRAQEMRVPAYDLTDGLMLIPLSTAPIPRPQKAEMPTVEAEEVQPTVEETAEEVVSAPAKDPVAEEDLDEEYEDGEYDLGELMTLALEEAGKIFARSFAAEFMRLLKK